MSTFNRISPLNVSAWTDGQTMFLRTHADREDDDLAVSLSLIGPPRTARSVAERRRVLGIYKPLAPADRTAHFRRSDGWPILPGTQEERDRKYVALLARALDQQEAT